MKSEGEPKRRHLNREEKWALMVAAIGLFIRRYRRTARRGGLDPNDRSFDLDVQRQLKRMAPEQLDRLMRDDEE